MPPADWDVGDDEPQPRSPDFPSSSDPDTSIGVASPSLNPIFTTSISTTTTTLPITTTTTILTSSTATTSTVPTSTCTSLDCSNSSRTCPPCKTGYVCRLTVIDSICQCPVASCVKAGFDTGADSGSLSTTSSNKHSALAPVLGSLAGLILVIVIAFFFMRCRRHRSKMNGDRLLDQEGQIDGLAESLNEDDKKSNHNGQRWPRRSNESNNQKDVIRIAYIPNTPETGPFRLPELSHLDGGPHASFLDDDSDKHRSLASSLSTVTLDEAVVMPMNNKATPKLLRLNAIKASNSELIQRSNSLHSSNSIKRTQSQKRAATKRGEDQKKEVMDNSPDKAIQREDQQDEQQYTPAVMVTGPSARSSAQSTSPTKRKPKPPNIVLEPRPLHPNYNVDQLPSPTKTLQNSTPNTDTPGSQKIVTSSISTPAALVSILTPIASANQTTVFTSSTPSLPTKGQDYITYSAEVLEGEERRTPGSYSPNNHSGGNSKYISNPIARNSTFSTQSDSRSTITRGDGEEITIFWDGHRDSRASNNI
ncbi:hypothetical protein BGZ49_003578 [Haplosporangium sp. Z 27]|nr:hypothetical protein BGZ49_003578 [Haplosporangium sp. Z 27]